MSGKVKRALSVFSAAAVVLSVSLICACEKKQVFPNEPITLPLENTYTLSYWMNLDSNYMNDYSGYSQHPYYNWLEEQTNIHIDFYTPTSASGEISDLRTEWVQMIASGSMTDMVEHYYFFPDLEGATIDSAEEEELYYTLNEYIDVQMPNFQALMAQYSVISKLIYTPYGNIMYIPKLTGVEDENKDAPITQGLAIRKDMLEELQLDVPETIGDWEETLTALKVSLGVENPLMLGEMRLDAALTGDPFLSAYGVSYKFFIDEDTGKLDYGCITEEMYEYVSLLNRWITEGIADMGTAVTEEHMLSNDTAAFYITVNQMIDFNSRSTVPNYELTACPYPVLNEGDFITVYDTYMPIGNQEVNATYITMNCDSPALAAKWLDQLFTEESFMRASYGEEGVDYNIDAEGNISFTSNVTGHEKGAVSGLYSRCLPTAMYCDRDVLVDLIYSDEQREAVETWSDVSRERSVIRTTSMNMTAEEQDTMSHFGNFWSIQTTSLKAFMSGTKDLSEWDDYVRQMNEAGLQEYIAIEQSAWDRYLAG